MGIGDTFSFIFGNMQYQYFCRQVHQLILSTTTFTVPEIVQARTSKPNTATVPTHWHHVIVTYSRFAISLQQSFY